ncbi:MAG: DNA polymerase III subunit delta [bacterium]|nr:DNA polymerase III subunit delta [bacterium]
MSSSSASETAHPPVVLVTGDSNTLRDAAIAELREQVIGEGPRDFNEDRFDLAGPKVDPGSVISVARTHPVMAPGRLLIVRGLGAKKAAKFIEQALIPYLEDPVGTTCLILEAEKLDKRLKWVKRVAKLGKLLDCAGPKRPAEAKQFVERRLKTLGKKPGQGTASALVELVGPDLDRLHMEIEKLVLYLGDRQEAGADDVAEVTGHLRPTALYELTDAIGRRKLAEALKILRQLTEHGEAPLAILGALANHFRRLLRARECRPLEAREVEARLSVHPYAARMLVEQARGFDLRRLRVCLEAVRRTDEALKGRLPLTPGLAIERLVLAVCS